MIRLSRQFITDADRDAVLALLSDDRDIARGDTIKRFEAAFAVAVGTKYAVAVNSGTTALYLACRAAGIGPGDKVGVPAITFAATANAPLLCGANVKYLDDGVDAADCTHIIPVWYAGHIHKPTLWVVDACHALGAMAKDGTKPGCFPAMACFSLHPAKQITCGEGGVVATNDEAIVRKLRVYRNNGIVYGPSHNPWRYHWVAASMNFWMSDINAALGLSQLRRLSRIIDERRAIAREYWQHLPDEARSYLVPDNADLDSFALFPVLIDFKRIGKTKTQVMFGLLKRGIETQVHYTPLHLQPMGGGKRGDLPHAELFYDQELSLPMHNAMTPDDAKIVCKALKEVIHG